MVRILACALAVGCFSLLVPMASPVLADSHLTAGKSANSVPAKDPRGGIGKATAAMSGVSTLGVEDRVLKRPVEDPADSAFVPVTISINYPSFGHADIDTDIRNWATGIADAFEKHFDGTVLAPIEVPEDSDTESESTAPAPVSLDLQASYRVSRPSANAVSITFELWNYTGGPSGNMDVITLNYSLITGQRLDLVDMFELPETALNLMSMFSRRELGKTMGGQRLMDGTEALPENFASLTLTPQGLRINFQPYQVAGWEMGAQELDMPLAELMAAGPLLTLWGK